MIGVESGTCMILPWRPSHDAKVVSEEKNLCLWRQLQTGLLGHVQQRHWTCFDR